MRAWSAWPSSCRSSRRCWCWPASTAPLDVSAPAAGISGSLDVSRQRSVLQLVGEVSALQTRAESLQSRADSIEGRLQALDGLTGRMSAVEDQVERMRAELEAASADVAAMQSDVDTLSAEVGELRQDMERVDSFLRGLRDLLTSLYPRPTPPPSTPTP